MGFLAGKRILICGLLSNRSIAYGVAKAMHREGASLAFTYQSERFIERITKFAAEFGEIRKFPNPYAFFASECAHRDNSPYQPAACFGLYILLNHFFPLIFTNLIIYLNITSKS